MHTELPLKSECFRPQRVDLESFSVLYINHEWSIQGRFHTCGLARNGNPGTGVKEFIPYPRHLNAHVQCIICRAESHCMKPLRICSFANNLIYVLNRPCRLNERNNGYCAGLHPLFRLRLKEKSVYLSNIRGAFHLRHYDAA